MNLRKANEYARKLFSTNWVKWVHEKTQPAESNAEKSTNVIKGTFSKHCAMCLNLNGCCFVANKCPPKPLHPNCHCYTIDILSITAKAECPIEKIRDYIFSELKSNGKKELFESWGYSIINSEEIKKEIEKQTQRAYSVGDYELGKLNDYGQRISIEITLKRLDKNERVSFLTGWMVYPNGRIVLTTPYGGKKHEIVR